MKPNSNLGKKIVMAAALLVLAGLVSLATAPADQPLSKEDVTLLLLGSSPSAKIIQLVEQRGVDFQMTPDLAKTFHNQGASDDLIDALQKAGNKPVAKPSAPSPAPPPPATNNATPLAAPEPSTEGKPNAPDAPEPRAETPPPAPAAPVAPTSPEPALRVRNSTTEGNAEAPVAPSLAPSTQPATPAAKSATTASNDAATQKQIQEILDDLASRPEATGGPAPALHIKDISGRKLSSDDLQGKVVLINFWATWCPYCRTEIPELVRMQAKFGSEGLQVVGIAVQDTERKVKDYAQANGINYPVAMGDESYKAIYGGVNGLPTSFLIGRDGGIYRKIVGAPMDMTVFDQDIRALLKYPAPRPTMTAQASPPAAPVAVTSSPESATPVAAKKETPPATPATASAPGLKEPDAQEIQHIIAEFAAKEKIFREARNNYTYHQINKVEELGSDNEIMGTYEQEWDILYDDSGKRIEKVTYAPLNTLKNLIVTKEDLEGFRNITPFVLTTDELPDYEIKYLGHVKVDQITAYVFNIRPKEIEKNRQYFSGVVWVDDRDLQIVKSEGKQVPQDKPHHGQVNLFPRFTTWREQVDGKFWFPTYTMGDDTLYFPDGPGIHMKEIVRYTDYKQFKSGVRILTVESLDKQKEQTTTPAAPPSK